MGTINESKVTKAVTELTQQYDNCSPNCFFDTGWKATTADLISRHTGLDSEFYSAYLRWRNTRVPWEDDSYFKLEQQKRVKGLIDNVIQHVKRNGIYIPPKNSSITNPLGWERLSSILGVLVIVFGAGYFLGVFFTSRTVTKEQIRLESELDSFRSGLKAAPVLIDSTDFKPQNKPQNQKTQKANENIHTTKLFLMGGT